jgi:glycosyltransferase involved in cell wall biosynthesis
MLTPDNTILFLLPVAFFQRRDDPGFQVQTQNFRTTFEYVLPQLRARGVNVALISLNNSDKQLQDGLDYFKQNKLDKQCHAWFFKRKMGHGRLFPQMVQFFINLWLIARILKQTKARVVYGYNDVGTLYGTFLKPIFRFRLAYDMRGDRVNEMAVQGAPAWRVSFYRRVRNRCLNTCDLVFTVSRTCRDLLPGKKHLPKYNFYNEQDFYFDARMARKMRHQLGLGERFVFVYSGTDKYYQMVPQMVAFFSQFLEICPDAWFMINVPVRSEKFLTELKRYNIPDMAWGMFHLDQTSLNHYQMVADVAFLIRQDLPLNHDAFPTKFSEYLASGVPVLITPHVHTLVEMVNEYQLGEVWHDSDTEENIQKRLLKYQGNQNIKEHCAAFAKEKLSWHSNAAWLAGSLHSLSINIGGQMEPEHEK